VPESGFDVFFLKMVVKMGGEPWRALMDRAFLILYRRHRTPRRENTEVNTGLKKI